MNDTFDATTVAFFRERLHKVNVIDELFDMSESCLRDQGLEDHDGQIIEATIDLLPKQHNSRKVNKEMRQIAHQMVGIKA